MSVSETKVFTTKVPNCIVAINKRTHFWYLIDKRTREVVNYGNMRAQEAGTYLDYLKLDYTRITESDSD